MKQNSDYVTLFKLYCEFGLLDSTGKIVNSSEQCLIITINTDYLFFLTLRAGTILPVLLAHNGL